MKEIKSILALYESLKSEDQRCAIAQVVRVEESSYRREGARMLVYESGIFEGGISGGCLEGDALKRSQIAIIKGSPSIVTYDTSNDDENQIGVGLGCNGVIDVLISPITPQNNTLQLLQKCVRQRRSHILVTITSADDSVDYQLGQTYYYDTELNQLDDLDDGPFKESLLTDLHTVKEKKKSKIYQYKIDDQTVRAFIEYIPAQYHLVVFGDNYDVYPILSLAKMMDWEVSLCGNLQKLKKEKLQSVTNIYTKNGPEKPKIDDRTAVILMAHDYKTDVKHLEEYVQSEAPYIACLGPKKRFHKMVQELESNGFLMSDAQLNRIYAPCGLEIGANTPEEIAMSICSEIITVFSGKPGGMLREKTSPIHDREIV